MTNDGGTYCMTEEYVSVYGNYANKLLRLQLDLIQALDRHRRGHSRPLRFSTSTSIPAPRWWLELSMRPEKTMQLERAKNDERPEAHAVT